MELWRLFFPLLVALAATVSPGYSQAGAPVPAWFVNAADSPNGSLKAGVQDACGVPYSQEIKDLTLSPSEQESVDIAFGCTPTFLIGVGANTPTYTRDGVPTETSNNYWQVNYTCWLEDLQTSCNSTYVYFLTAESPTDLICPFDGSMPDAEGNCPDSCQDLAGTAYAGPGYVQSSTVPYGCTAQNCAVTFTGSGPDYVMTNGVPVPYYQGSYYYSGAECTGPLPPPLEPAPTPSCGDGQSFGYLNDKLYCYDQGDPSNPEDPAPDPTDESIPDPLTKGDLEIDETVTDNGDGTTTKTRTETTTMPDGSTKTSTTTTTCDYAGNCSTSTDTEYSGTPGGTGETPSDAEELGEQEQAGDTYQDRGCDYAPSCTGDVLQCAIAYQAWETRCALSVPSEALDITEADIAGQILGDSELTIESHFDPENELNQIDVEDYFDAPFVGGGSCPSDYSFSVLGSSVSISWSYFCEFAQYVRPVMLAIAWIVSGLLFYRGLIRDF